MQSLGIIAFACMMGTMSLYVVLQAIIELIQQHKGSLSKEFVVILASMSAVIVVKFILFIVCRSHPVGCSSGRYATAPAARATLTASPAPSNLRRTRRSRLTPRTISTTS